MESLFGQTLTSKTGEISTLEALQGKVVGIYFSAHWCGPCRGFTPVLSQIYNQLKQSGKPFEIVFVSSDRDEDSFIEYHGEMPWLALPFSDRERKTQLSKKYKVQGIPSLVLIDENCKTITLDGRSAISGDPNAFPWIPKTVHELLEGDLRKSDGSVVPFSSIQGKNIALYFSAHWCPPCRGFTPKLADLYNTKKSAGGDDFEFIFVSSDRDEASFNEYHGEQPWLALPFSKRKEKETLSNLFGVEGIPTLVTLDPQGGVINKNARGAASEDPTGIAFPWKPKPMENLTSTVECNGFDVNEKPAVILFCDGATAQVKQQCSETLMAVATELSVGADPDFIFFTAPEHAGPVPQVKKLIGLPEELISTPIIAILDIPDEGGFYIDTPASITAESIKETINKYNTKALTRSQMKR